jgi:hypothetical protein
LERFRDATVRLLDKYKHPVTNWQDFAASLVLVYTLWFVVIGSDRAVSELDSHLVAVLVAVFFAPALLFIGDVILDGYLRKSPQGRFVGGFEDEYREGPPSGAVDARLGDGERRPEDL